MAEDNTPAPATSSTLERLLGESEPVRRALYPIVVCVVALLVAYGLLDAERVPLWLALAVAVLGPSSIEAARAVVYSPATVADLGTGWQTTLETEYARGVAAGLERTPDRVAAEIVDDEPGAHAADRVRGDDDETGLIPVQAADRATRCREVEDGRRCLLTRDHEGPHHMTTG